MSWQLPLAASLLYGAMIFFGQRLMANRAPLNPKGAMCVYNAYQSLLNGWMAAWLLYQAYRSGFSIWGNSEQRGVEGYRVAFGLWLHYNNKYVELLDTLFMVLRKKGEQVSFLHVYHHVLLVWSWFVAIKLCCGGDAYFGSAFNSFVHFWMYAYYACALLGVPAPWKKFLTQFQLFQFVCCASQSFYVLYKQHIWWPVPALQLFVMLNMLYLFSKFYAKKYTKATKSSSSSGKSSVQFDFESHVSTRARELSPSPTFSTAVVRASNSDSDDASAASPTAGAPVASVDEQESPIVLEQCAAPDSSDSSRSGATPSPRQSEVEDDLVLVDQPTKATSNKKRSNKAE